MPTNYWEIADFEVTVNRRPLSNAMAGQIAQITVDDQVDLPGMFTLELEASLNTGLPPAWLNDKKLFAIGDKVVIRLGYVNKLQTIITGEITFVEIDFNVERPPHLKVRGYDSRHRLQRGRKTRTFLKMKDSDIVNKIVSEAGLNVQTTDSQVVYDYLIQANQTDFDFIRERARRINFELIDQDTALLFRPVKTDAAPALKLSIDNELSKFNAQLSVTGQITQAEVRGWDAAKKQETAAKIKHRPSAGSPTNLSGSAVVAKAFGEAAFKICDEPTGNMEEAKSRAEAELAARQLTLVRGVGDCWGRGEIKAGKVVEIKGVGNRFSGNYYITAVTHNYGSNGYQTHFTAWRNII